MAVALEEILSSEVAAATPFRITTLVIFALAVIHTLLANHFTALSEKLAKKHPGKVHFWAEVLHFFGEVEVIFALWVIPLVMVVTIFFGWKDVVNYLDSRIYVEPFFIVVIMSLSATRPIIQLAEKAVKSIAGLFGGSTRSFWLTLMTLGPILGSLITEAAAMTITALLLKDKLYLLSPTKRLAYGTLGLMFVNFSVGGVLTNFAAPPALILSRCFGWSIGDFIDFFALKVILGIALVNALYFFFLRKDLKALRDSPPEDKRTRRKVIPLWVTLVHMGFILWTIVMAHYPPVFLGSYLLFLGFHQATRTYQYTLNLKRPLLVGLFLAGLVIHGGFQGWWIEPLIGNLGYGAMMLTGTVLTAFNENSTVAYLACLLDEISPHIRYALASGLVAGGGLTIIAHAPNPAGQALLSPYFTGGISPWNLFLAALVPTLIFLAIFFLFPSYSIDIFP